MAFLAEPLTTTLPPWCSAAAARLKAIPGRASISLFLEVLLSRMDAGAKSSATESLTPTQRAFPSSSQYGANDALLRKAYLGMPKPFFAGFALPPFSSAFAAFLSYLPPRPMA